MTLTIDGKPISGHSHRILSMSCVICKKPHEPGAVMLCKKHWDEYKKRATGDFKKFQKYRKKIEDGLIKHRDI